MWKLLCCRSTPNFSQTIIIYAKQILFAHTIILSSNLHAEHNLSRLEFKMKQLCYPKWWRREDIAACLSGLRTHQSGHRLLLGSHTLSIAIGATTSELRGQTCEHIRWWRYEVLKIGTPVSLFVRCFDVLQREIDVIDEIIKEVVRETLEVLFR